MAPLRDQLAAAGRSISEEYAMPNTSSSPPFLKSSTTLLWRSTLWLFSARRDSSQRLSPVSIPRTMRERLERSDPSEAKSKRRYRHQSQKKRGKGNAQPERTEKEGRVGRLVFGYSLRES
jgi:hypothetical protein